MDISRDTGMKLFTIGPTQLDAGTLAVKGRPLPYFRTEEFSEQTLDAAARIKRVMGAEEDARVIMLTASGTGAMEAAVVNCFDERDCLLVVAGGSFGRRFAQICDCHGIPHADVRIGDQALTRGDLEAAYRPGMTGLLVNLHETSTGQLYDIAMLRDFCADRGLFMVADAIGTFLCDPYNMGENGVDLTIISSQKGLCLSPGISIAVVSGRLFDRVRAVKRRSFYFDFLEYEADMARGQTPFTPAVGIMLELFDMLERVERAGVKACVAKVRARALHFRSHICGLPARVPSYPLSNAITPLLLDDCEAMPLFTYLYRECGMFVNPTGGANAGRMLRVAHAGDLCEADNIALIDAMDAYFRRRI